MITDTAGSVGWNPWHGCTKISAGCKHCYVYREDAMFGTGVDSSETHKNADFMLPVQRRRDRSFKVPSGSIVYTCFTSDFLLDRADAWRKDAWMMMRQRRDLTFYFFTKRIDRFAEIAPDDWGNGYDNVIVGCTVENQAMADYRLPIFKKLPIRHKTIIAAPLLEAINLSTYLDNTINYVSVGGESGTDARVCDFDWVIDIRRQCMEERIPFNFHQTGAHFRKDGKLYYIKRPFQKSQAEKACIDYYPI